MRLLCKHRPHLLKKELGFLFPSLLLILFMVFSGCRMLSEWVAAGRKGKASGAVPRCVVKLRKNDKFLTK